MEETLVETQGVKEVAGHIQGCAQMVGGQERSGWGYQPCGQETHGSMGRGPGLLFL